MKKVLITGANSYIGTSFENYIKENFPNEYSVDTVDMLDPAWREKSFSAYDCVFHVAGIAHQKETKENAHLYYSVNCDLAVEVANKSKTDGVKQFIFLSSMSVYGMESGVITKNTIPNPKSHYGKSKLQAEEKITALGDETFKVAIVRPPMVYGKDCKGNFQTVVKIVKKSPVFPKVDNKRSMIYIETLCAYLRCYIETEVSGIYLPQNEEYMNTTEMAKNIAVSLNKKIYASVILGIVVKMFLPFVKVLEKAFGTLVYDKEPEKIVVAAKSNKESVIESV